MNVEILHLIEGAKEAKGLTVIIDVFRAFSLECYAFKNNVEKIIPVGNINIAYKLKENNPDYILVGERGGVIQPGFDYGNSPSLIEKLDFKNKTIVHTTSAGTQGIANATNSDEIITGSFVNIQAIIDYIKLSNPKVVSLVAMGDAGVTKSDEDTLCAEYIKNALEGKTNDFSEIKKHLRTYQSGAKFFDSSQECFPEADFDRCLQLNKFNFVLKVNNFRDTNIYVSKI